MANDTVIDYYFSLLLLNDSSYISFSSYFYTALNTKGIGTVQNWYAKSNFFDKKKIFIPILENSHWILVVVRHSHTKFLDFGIGFGQIYPIQYPMSKYPKIWICSSIFFPINPLFLDDKKTFNK